MHSFRTLDRVGQGLWIPAFAGMTAGLAPAGSSPRRTPGSRRNGTGANDGLPRPGGIVTPAHAGVQKEWNGRK